MPGEVSIPRHLHVSFFAELVVGDQSCHRRYVRGFAKLKKMDRAQPNPNFNFLKPITDNDMDSLTEHSNHNNRQLLAMYTYRQNTHASSTRNELLLLRYTT